MNKKLIALAVAGAFVAPVAMAQTANPVTLYGRVHLTFDYVESKGSVGQSKRSKVTDQASRLGVRGSEDLGGGLKAFFQLETAFQPDQAPTVGATGGATGWAGRNSAVGLQGGWGSVFMGRWDTPFKMANGDVDPFGDVTIAGLTTAMSDQGNFDRRDNNMVQYWSPNWGGFAFKAMYQANEGKTGNINPYDHSYSATFNRGPFYVFASWEEHKHQLGSTTGTAGVNEEGLAVGGTWAVGPVKLGLLWQEFKKTGRTKRESIMGNVVWTLGNNQLIYQYQQSEDGAANGAAQPECDMNAVAWRYNFSRRTMGYLLYSKIDNNAVANCGSQGTGFGSVATTGSDPQGFSIGMQHNF